MRQLKITKQVTNRETKSLNSYLQDVSKIDLITAEEEVELAQRIRGGDQEALDKLTKSSFGIFSNCWISFKGSKLNSLTIWVLIFDKILSL